MEFNTIQQFLSYYVKVKKRTRRIIDCIPPDKIEWTFQEGKFTMGDLIRHLANIERYLYAESAQFRPGTYAGCGTEFALGYNATVAYYDKMHRESMEIFSKLTDRELQKIITPADSPITLWKWLRLMIEHEVHHRGQIYLYLSMLGVSTPPLFGLTAEQVMENLQ